MSSTDAWKKLMMKRKPLILNSYTLIIRLCDLHGYLLHGPLWGKYVVRHLEFSSPEAKADCWPAVSAQPDPRLGAAKLDGDRVPSLWQATISIESIAFQLGKATQCSL